MYTFPVKFQFMN